MRKPLVNWDQLQHDQEKLCANEDQLQVERDKACRETEVVSLGSYQSCEVEMKKQVNWTGELVDESTCRSGSIATLSCSCQKRTRPDSQRDISDLGQKYASEV